MNILLDNLQQEALINGRRYDFDTNFRTAIHFACMTEKNLDDEDFVYSAIELFFRNERPNPIDAINYILWFYQGGSKEDKPNASNNKNTNIMSYKHDAGRIFASFLAVYKIDLTETCYMHWWKFKALFDALPDDCEIMKVIGFRAAKIDPKMSKQQKEYLKKMKQLYALPRPEAEQQMHDALVEALRNGGNVDAILRKG